MVEPEIVNETHSAPKCPARRMAPPTRPRSASTPRCVVALAMVVVLIILAWKKVPSAIGKSLDTKIAAIRAQLDEAEGAAHGSRGAQGRI